MNIKIITKSRAIVALLAMIAILSTIFACFATTKQSTVDISLPDNYIAQSYSDDGSITLAKYNSVSGTDIDSVYSILEHVSGAYGYKDTRRELVLSAVNDYYNGLSYTFDQYHCGLPVYGRGIKVIAHYSGGYTITSNFVANITAKHDARLTAERVAIKNSASYCAKVYYPSDTSVIAGYIITTDVTNSIIDSKFNILENIVNVRSYAYTRLERSYSDYYGNAVTLPVEQASGQYYMQDGVRNIYMVDAGYRESYSSTSVISSSTGDFTNKRAVSAMDNIIKAYDYYNVDNIGVNFAGLNGKNDNIAGNASSNGERTLHVYVNYGNAYSNAAYVNFSNGKDKILLGNGKNSSSASVYETSRSTEIIAHEYQHGITTSLAGLQYVGESGALDEAISDIFAALVSGQDINSEEFWLIAEDGVPTASRALRNMANPIEFGDKMDYQQLNKCTKWHITHDNTCDYNYVHSNSGIINYTFHQIWDNDKDTFDTKTLGKLIFNSLHLLISTSTFKDFYNALIETATDLELPSSALTAIRRAFNTTNITSVAEDNVSVTYSRTNECSGNSPATKSYITGESVTIPTNPGLLIGGMDFYLWQNKSATGDEKRYYKSGETFTIKKSITLSPIFTPSVWNNVPPSALVGSGSKTDPFLISSAADLATIGYYHNSISYLKEHGFVLPDGHSGGYYKQTADIDLQGMPWTPISGLKSSDTFASLNYDGGGFTISNMVISGDIYYNSTGLFGAVSGTFANIHLSNSTISNSNSKISYSGSIIGNLIGGSIRQSSAVCNITNNTSVFTKRSNGGIVGTAERSIISDCYSTGRISGYTSGGIVGTLSSSIVTNSYNGGTISGTCAGGIAGAIELSSIVNCFNIGGVAALRFGANSDTPNLGGIVGQFSANNASHDSTITLVGNRNHMQFFNNGIECNIGNMIGNIYVTSSGSLLHYDNNYYGGNKYTATNSRGTTILADIAYGSGALSSSDALYSGQFDFDNADFYSDMLSYSSYSLPHDTNSVWRINNNEMPTLLYNPPSMTVGTLSGNGSSESPYLINNADDLITLSLMVSEGALDNAHYLMTANIDMTGIIMQPIGSVTTPFNGDFNGGGYSITGLRINGTPYQQGVGLFGYVNNATISNLNLTADASGTYGGLLIGQASGAIIISNVSVSGTVSSKYSGGLIGYVDSNSMVSINNITMHGTVIGECSGGLIGYLKSECAQLSNCDIKASISGNIAGGVIGKLSGESRFDSVDIDCDMVGVNMAEPPLLGGIIGVITSGKTIIHTATTVGNIIGDAGYYGGIIGGITTNGSATDITIDSSISKIILPSGDSYNSALVLGYVVDNASSYFIDVSHSVIIGKGQFFPSNINHNSTSESENTALKAGERKVLYYVNDECYSYELVGKDDSPTMTEPPPKLEHTIGDPPWLLTSSNEYFTLYSANYITNTYNVKLNFVDVIGGETGDNYTLTVNVPYGSAFDIALINFSEFGYSYTYDVVDNYDNNIVTSDREYTVNLTRTSRAIRVYIRGKLHSTMIAYDGIYPILPDIDSIDNVVAGSAKWRWTGSLSTADQIELTFFFYTYELATIILVSIAVLSTATSLILFKLNRRRKRRTAFKG